MDINNPPPGGFEHGGWYWNPDIGQAQRYWNGTFLPAGQTEPAPEPVQQQESTDPVLDFLNESAEQARQQYDEYYQRLEDFDEANPYNADEWLASERAQAEQRLDPYYTQTLNDYLEGVQTKRTRSLEDERTLLTELQADEDYYTDRARIGLDRALEKSREGYADAGLYSSGASLRDQGQLTEENQAEVGDYQRQTGERKDRIESTTERTLEDIRRNRQMTTRDIEQERQYNIESAAQQGLGNRLGQYAFERSTVAGAPPGVNPVNYDIQSFGLLR